MRTSGLLTNSCGQYGCNDDANPLHRAAIAAGRRQSQAGFRRSLRCAARGLTPPRVDGLFATKSFGEETGPKRPVSSPKLLVANKPRRAIAVTRRAGAKRRTRHSAAQGYDLARSLPALWRVDGDRPAWRRGAERLRPRRAITSDFPRTALRKRGEVRRGACRLARTVVILTTSPSPYLSPFRFASRGVEAQTPWAICRVLICCLLARKTIVESQKYAHLPSNSGRFGRRCAQGRARSNAAAHFSSKASAPHRPTSWRPIGRPALSKPQGRLIAGLPVRLNGIV